MEIKTGMKIRLFDSMQEAFPARLECDCGIHNQLSMEPIYQIIDDYGEIAKNKPTMKVHGGTPHWPHDAMIAVAYMCVYCLKIRTLWNQG